MTIEPFYFSGIELSGHFYLSSAGVSYTSRLRLANAKCCLGGDPMRSWCLFGAKAGRLAKWGSKDCGQMIAMSGQRSLPVTVHIVFVGSGGQGWQCSLEI